MRKTGLWFLVAWCAATHAGVGQWTSVGIPGADVSRVEYVRSGVAVAVTSAGVYRTTNHGASWMRVRETGESDLPGIGVNRANPDQVLINAAPPMRSVSGGVDFAPFSYDGTYYGSGARNVGFTQDGSFALLIDADGIVWRSADAGLTWTKLSASLPADYYWFMEPDIADVGTLYAGAGSGIFITRNAGDSWTQLSSATGSYAVTPSRTTSGTALAIITNPGYFNINRTIDFGATWTPAPNGPTNIFRLATGPGSHAIASDYTAVIHTSNNDGLTWTTRDRLPNAEARWITMDRADANHVLAATTAGIVGSDDGGITWQERNQGMIDPRALDIVVARDGSNAVYVTTRDLPSIYRRDPSTGAFTGIARASTPLLGYPGFQRYFAPYQLAISPQNSRTLYMARDGNYGRSTDGGVTWTRIATTEVALSLALDPVNSQVAYLGGVTSNWKTLDGGINWAPISGGLPSGVGRFLVDPSNNAIVYATLGGYPGAASPIYKSIDGGANWMPMPWTGPASVAPMAMAFEPGRTSTIYLALQEGLYKSTDSAATWTRLTPYAAIPLAGFNDVIVDPQVPTTVYAASFGDVTRSIDGGATWSDIVPLSETLWVNNLVRIALVPGKNARIIGIRRSGGVFEVDVPVNLALSRAIGTWTAGSSSTINLTASNAGQTAATRVRITSTLPAASGSYSVASSAGTCSVDVRELTCDLGTLAVAASATASVTFTPVAAGDITFTLSAHEIVGAGASAVVTVMNAPSGSSSGGGGGGGGGGGRLDYLLLGALLFTLHGRRRYAGVFRRVRQR